MAYDWEQAKNAVQVALWEYEQAWDGLLDRVWYAFPNPLTMFDELIRALSNLRAIPVILIFDLVVLAMPVPTNNKVMTELGAWRVMVNGSKDFLRFMTDLDEKGLVEVLINWIARMAWKWFKTFKLLHRLLGVRGETDFVKLFVRKLRSRFFFALFLVIVAWGGLFWSIVWLAFMAVNWDELAKKRLLQQNNPLTSEPHKTRRNRQPRPAKP